jgi:hypothetical protein
MARTPEEDREIVLAAKPFTTIKVLSGLTSLDVMEFQQKPHTAKMPGRRRFVLTCATEDGRPFTCDVDEETYRHIFKLSTGEEV